MKLYKELLRDIILKNPDLISINEEEVKEIFNSTCYMALKRIKMILEDDTLSDKECFLKIEEIVSVYESIDSGCGARHDFG